MRKIEFKLGKDEKNRAVVIENIASTINELDLDNIYQVTVGNYNSSKTEKQRRLDWRWNNEIARSGIGSNDDAEGVHMNGKWVFARPLLLAGDDDYSKWIQDMWNLIIKNYENDPNTQKQFFVYAVHTEKMVKEMVSEYLKSKQYYWTSKGVNLTDPSLAGLNDI